MTQALELSACDREPIHVPGSIQPSGFLLALTSDWIIVRATTNTDAYLGQAPEQLIGRPLAEVVPLTVVHDLRNRTSRLLGHNSIERLFGCEMSAGGPKFDASIHLSGDHVIVEAEPATPLQGDASGLVRSMVSRLDLRQGEASFFREGARQVRAILGFDRVMVYRFARDGAGEVVAEACRPGVDEFMGLRYPASDIPAQARELYTRSLLRLISDVDADPVMVVPALDEEGSPLDLSLSTLRAVSPIHIEYLRNMGVAASLSISILVDGKLWGLFACHHNSPAHPSVEVRSIAELFVQLFASRIESREHRELVEFERRTRDVSDQLLGAVASHEALLGDPDWLGDILTSIVPADGVGIWIHGKHAFSGATPTATDFRRIVRALNSTANGKVFSTDRIGSLVPDADSFADRAAGMLAIPISRTPRDYVVLFRQEQLQTIRWAGDPNAKISVALDSSRLTPRKSFAEWKETIRGHSQPFTASELRISETLRATLVEVVLRLADETSAERQKASARQELLIAELNHRVRNILGVIRGLVRQSQTTDPSANAFVRVVDGRIHALARAHNQITDDHWGPAPLQALIDAEARAFVDMHERVLSEGQPVLLNPQAYSTMALVLHELVTNSTKYGSLSLPRGTVRISWLRDRAGDLVLTWLESGGPSVKPPSRKGFGTTIIDRSVPYDLGGNSKIEFKPRGVEAVFRIPARHVADQHGHLLPMKKFARPASGHPVTPPPRLLEGHELLLVEDSLIIALDAEDIANRLGAASVTLLASMEAALESIDTRKPSVAMLDINLGDRNSFAIADALQELGIPFLFATGYGEQALLPMHHRGRIVIQKPYTLENVARAMDELLRPRTATALTA